MLTSARNMEKVAATTGLLPAGASTTIQVMVQVDPQAPPAELLSAGVEDNVRRVVRELLETPEAKARMADSGMRLVGAVYELETGSVRFLD